MEIHLNRGDQQAGPFSQEQVHELIRAGDVQKTDQLWFEGLPTWCCLGMRAEYQSIFQEVETAQQAAMAAATPPPLPTEAAPEPTASTQQPDPAIQSAPPEVSPAEPIMYRPGMRPLKKESEQEADDFGAHVKPLVDAPIVSKWAASIIDGLVVMACFWVLSAIILPKGIGMSDVGNYGEGLYYDSYEDPAFEAKVAELDDQFYEDEDADWDDYDAAYETLEQEWMEQRAATMGARERYLMGASTPEELSKVNRYYMLMIAFGLLFTVLQYFMLAKRGQTIGRMFMDIKLINECTQEAPGHNVGLIIHTFYPRFKMAETAVVKV